MRAPLGRADPIETRSRIERGDFQTPRELADQCCRLVAAVLPEPSSLLEPTCGVGNFLAAGLDRYPRVDRALGLEVQAAHVRAARAELPAPVEIVEANLFETELEPLLQSLPGPILVLGNPPWVTSAQLGTLGSAAHPRKRNTDALSGMDARTGKSNFDVSEWILRRFFDQLRDQELHLALIVKASVARKALSYAWQHQLPIRSARFHRIDAKRAFKVTVDAGLLIVEGGEPGDRSCGVFEDLCVDAPELYRFGQIDGVLVADLAAYDAAVGLRAVGPGEARWRSGIKHDCARVLELVERDGSWINGLDEVVQIEPDLLYPLLKSSDLARGRPPGRRQLVVPQRRTSDDTSQLSTTHPRAWEYLTRHADRLDARKSSIYRNRSRFAIFGVGDYSFAPWKVSVSAMYPRPSFRLLGPEGGRPVVVDDTCYFLGFDRQADAERVCAALGSPSADAFFRAFSFTDGKRPITAELLGALDIHRLCAIAEPAPR